MKLFVFFLTLTMFNLASAMDLEGGVHTPDFCSEINAKICAHLKFDQFPTTSSESEFVTHIFSATGAAVQNVKVKLWMDMGNGHGHGSAPVVLSALEEVNHFHVQNAWFVMMGEWQVIVSFTDTGIEQKIIIPLQIKQ